MEPQLIFNFLVAIIGILGGWVLKSISDRMDSLQAADASLTSKVQAIEVLVAGKYVTWEGLRDAIAPLTAYLARIETKIDGKADR